MLTLLCVFHIFFFFLKVCHIQLSTEIYPFLYSCTCKLFEISWFCFVYFWQLPSICSILLSKQNPVGKTDKEIVCYSNGKSTFKLCVDVGTEKCSCSTRPGPSYLHEAVLNSCEVPTMVAENQI